ncbi:CGNR zinc finger domain-containing protein [Kribbella koreensis]|uniref:CGNR zinc finger domain-containing protein n=1 Tax=Kribbella koreensis TaxID=57909 RepID=A0ABN1PQS3_9ACTN
MTSPATERFTLDPAPDTLALAHDFLNTRGVGTQPDLLADLATATAWLERVLPGEAKLTATDLEVLRAFRTELHRLVVPEGAAPESVAEVGARGVAAELVLGVDGTVELRGGGTGAEYVTSRVLAEVLAGQQVDSWRRLKACKNDRCRVVFYDRSRNNSGVWHSLKTCGNPANLRAFRARNKEASS